jgi:hypothetical protein
MLSQYHVSLRVSTSELRPMVQQVFLRRWPKNVCVKLNVHELRFFIERRMSTRDCDGVTKQQKGAGRATMQSPTKSHQENE